MDIGLPAAQQSAQFASDVVMIEVRFQTEAETADTRGLPRQRQWIAAGQDGNPARSRQQEMAGILPEHGPPTVVAERET